MTEIRVTPSAPDFDAPVLDFDAWRESYEAQTFAEQQEFYDEVYRQYPSQVHWTWESAYQAIKLVRPKTVVELGGWDGALARIALSVFPEIERWTNLEICREVVEHSRAQGDAEGRYSPRALFAHVWEDRTQVPEADLAVATHTFEHLSLTHVLGAVEALNPTIALYVEIPIDEIGKSWGGYHGSHILEVGWQGFELALKSIGWEQVAIGGGAHGEGTCRLYVRG